MVSRRAQKAAQAIRAVVGTAILQEIKDPRVQHVTVTYVEVSDDLRHAKVHVSVMGDDTQQRLCLQGLRSAAGFLQSRIAQRIDMRYTPRITFVLDQGVKRSIEIASILRDVLPPEYEDGAGEDVEDLADQSEEIDERNMAGDTPEPPVEQ